MCEFRKGDYVVFVSWNGDGEIGRVASVGEDNVFVCFTIGCTASACDPASLRVVEAEPWMTRTAFGHHRFDTECPEYDPGCCSAYCPEKGGAEVVSCS